MTFFTRVLELVEFVWSIVHYSYWFCAHTCMEHLGVSAERLYRFKLAARARHCKVSLWIQRRIPGFRGSEQEAPILEEIFLVDTRERHGTRAEYKRSARSDDNAHLTMGWMAKCCLGVNDAPCNCHNAMCCFFARLPCCGCKNCLETYDEMNRKDIKKMRKDPGAPQAIVMTTPAPVGAPQAVQPQ